LATSLPVIKQRAFSKARLRCTLSTPMADNTLQLDKFTTETRNIVGSAQTLADELGHSEVSPLHLLARVLEYDHGVHEVFRRAGADPTEVMSQTEAAMRRLPKQTSGVAYLSDRMIDLLKRAEREAQRDKAESVGLEHVLHALAQEIRGPAGEILSAQGIGPGGFRSHVGALKDAPKTTAAATGGGGALKASTSGGGGSADPAPARAAPQKPPPVGAPNSPNK
jgi:ATP-dependent Clp protease ATP-binding subunit ClpB